MLIERIFQITRMAWILEIISCLYYYMARMYELSYTKLYEALTISYIIRQSAY